MFLVALDRTVIGTAVPAITNSFGSLGDIGWYGAAYLITSCCFQLLFGRIYTFYHPKWVFVISVIIFEIGSALCGAAPTSTAFIIGRAIAGLGSAGIFSGATIIIVNIVPLHKRPMYQGFMGGIFGIASIIGPLFGGALTEKTTWRWCFYINLPVGGAVLLVLVAVLRIPWEQPAGSRSWKQQFIQLDPLGTALFLPGCVCLLLALEWGGGTYKWSNARIIVLLVLAFLLLIGFCISQVMNKKYATVPIRVIKQRSILAGIIFSLCIGGILIIMVYYLPLWFQAIKDAKPVRSGVMNLPFLLALMVAAAITGGSITRFGYYTPALIGSSILMSIGIGLMTTWKYNTGSNKWIGYQVIFGFGLGMGMQQPGIAAQTVLSRKDVPTGVALMFFTNALGGAIFLAVAQSVFTNRLVADLRSTLGSNLTGRIVEQGATDIRKLTNGNAAMLRNVLIAYNDAIMKTLCVALALACASIVGALLMEWRDVRGVRKRQEEFLKRQEERAKAREVEKQNALDNDHRHDGTENSLHQEDRTRAEA
ncbi:MFS general substrate transporter [Ascobolus immersus RN42]|uniref:MFS general substrate transporter n=1 Tax=Ascobolus immersus RN42 TaxID=1160509 RepID=A0A3N4IQ26_ASCIM|nr:MFS general substrate transporter [Ascobolus immersus RN42]